MRSSLDLPDFVVVQLLRRELLLTKTKLQGLMFDQLQAERKLRRLKNQLCQVMFKCDLPLAALLVCTPTGLDRIV